jgi:hypothetical protein
VFLRSRGLRIPPLPRSTRQRQECLVSCWQPIGRRATVVRRAARRLTRDGEERSQHQYNPAQIDSTLTCRVWRGRIRGRDSRSVAQVSSSGPKCAPEVHQISAKDSRRGAWRPVLGPMWVHVCGARSSCRHAKKGKSVSILQHARPWSGGRRMRRTRSARRFHAAGTSSWRVAQRRLSAGCAG